MRLELADYLALSPLIILLLGALGILILECIKLRGAFILATATLVAALLATLQGHVSHHPLLTVWLIFDGPATLFTLFFLGIGLACTLLTASFFERFEVTSKGEFYFLILAATFGLVLIGASNDFLTLFLGVETLSLSLYVLCSYMKKWELSSESAMKYFFMGSLAAAFLLYGIAFLYGAIGNTHLEGLLASFQKLSGSDLTLFWAGIAFITLALSFEATIVPFQTWAPDVYAAAPNPVTAFMAVGTKVGAFAAFTRIFLGALPGFSLVWSEGIALLAYPTLIFANFVALKQKEMRRFFAYSGMAHAGYLLLPFVSNSPQAFSALFFYLIVYAIATLACFATLAFLDHKSEGVQIEDLRGLFFRSPFLAILLALALLTLAGIPPTLGFFAKFYVFKLAFNAGFLGLVIVALLTSILAAFYYLRIAALLFTPLTDSRSFRLHWAVVFLGSLALMALIFFSLYPGAIYV